MTKCLYVCTAIHLLSCLTKSDVYSLAFDDLIQGVLERCGISAFYEIWQYNLPYKDLKVAKEAVGFTCQTMYDIIRYLIVPCEGKKVV